MDGLGVSFVRKNVFFAHFIDTRVEKERKYSAYLEHSGPL